MSKYTKGVHTLEQQGEYNDCVRARAIGICYAINPDNPMAVAESISDLYEALKYIIRELDKADIIKANSIFMLMPVQALAKVESK